MVIGLHSLLLFVVPLHAVLVNRWSFTSPNANVAPNTTLFDTVSGVPLIVRGNGATFGSNRMNLPGSTAGTPKRRPPLPHTWIFPTA